jgi:hypothetical protein
MSKLALGLIALAVATGCEDDADFPDETGSGDSTQMRELRAELQSRDAVLEGSVTVQTNLDAEAFTATIVLRGDLPNAVRYWFVVEGSCDAPLGQVGDSIDYPYLVIGEDGTAASSSIVFTAIDPDAINHAIVQDAAKETLACGNFIEQVFQPQL